LDGLVLVGGEPGSECRTRFDYFAVVEVFAELSALYGPDVATKMGGDGLPPAQRVAEAAVCRFIAPANLSWLSGIGIGRHGTARILPPGVIPRERLNDDDIRRHRPSAA
jgi:hypothetical protein